jgi:hypothetical protein
MILDRFLHNIIAVKTFYLGSSRYPEHAQHLAAIRTAKSPIIEAQFEEQIGFLVFWVTSKRQRRGLTNETTSN